MNLLTDADGAFAVFRARELVEAAVRRKPVEEIVYPPAFAPPRGVFVTLTEFGELRGCIGIPYPVMPLSEALEDAAVSAAVRDPRFRPVEPAELADISLEVTVLTPPEALICPPAAERWQHVEGGTARTDCKGREPQRASAAAGCCGIRVDAVGVSQPDLYQGGYSAVCVAGEFVQCVCV